MGILIVAFLGVLGWGLYKRVSEPEFKLIADDSTGTAKKTPAIIQKPFGNVQLSLPPQCSLVEMKPQQDRLYLRGDCGVVAVVDVASGRLLGTLTISP